MADDSTDPDFQPLGALIETLIVCPQEDLLAWIQEHQRTLSTSLLQHLKDNHVTASHILADPYLTDRLTQYALTIAGVIATSEPLALALAQWMRGMWANFNDMAEAVLWYRSALPAFEAINDQLSVARLLANLVSVLAAVGKNQEAEECYHRAYPFFLTYCTQDPKYLIYLEQSFGWLLHTWGRYEEALAVHNRALSLATTHQLQISIAEIQVNLALTLAKLGRLAEVEALLQHDKEIARQSGEVVTVARIEMNLGELYNTQGRPVDALRCFQQAATGAVAMEQGFILARQANLLQRLGAMSAALHQYESALESIKQFELKPFIAETQCNIAACLRLIGNRNGLKRAARHLDQAEIIWRSLGNELRLVQVQFERISLALAKNDYTQAFTLLESFPEPSANPHIWAEYRFCRAETSRLAQGSGVDLFHKLDIQSIEDDYLHVLNFATEQGLRWLQRNALSGLGKLYLESDWQKAKTYLEEATAIDDQIRQMLTLEELKATFHEQANDLYDDLIQSSWQHQDYEAVLLYTWRAKAAAFLELAQNLGNASIYTAEQQIEIELLRQQIAALRWSLAKEASSNLLPDSYEQTNPELASLTNRLLDVRRQANQQQTQNLLLNADSVNDVLTKMDGEILLEYVRCGDDLYGICASKEGIHTALRLTDATTIAEVSGHLALSLYSGREPTATTSNSAFDKVRNESLTYLHQCYQLLVSPFAAILQAFAVDSKLFIAPCDVLAMLPFAAFWNGNRYLIEDFEIELIQSGVLFLLPIPTTKEHSPAVVIAASTENVTQVRKEANQVAQQFQPSVTFIDIPSLAYLDSLQNAPQILHIAAHTIQRSISPFFSGIQLSNEVLSVEHCYDLPLWGCELVTLSGCATAAGLESDASLFAFQSACLLAGAKHVLCSLWAIADEMPAHFMEIFYQKLKQAASVSTALRQTQIELINRSATRQPANWAAFAVIRR